MAENMYESTDKEHSVLYDMFSLDLGQTIRLVKALEMFNAEKVGELNDIRILRNIVMHHNLLILGKDKSLKKIRENKAEMKNRIVALANNLPKNYGQNFISDINALRCDFREYKITIEAGDERYVSKRELKPLRKQFHEWMQLIHDPIKARGVSFTYMLVGSAKRNLVVRNHNKGYDCDYQIKLTRNENGLEAQELKDLFRDALNRVIKKDDYSDCENSTSSLTIKKKGDRSNIENAYDIVILVQDDAGLKILRYHKPPKGEGYVFELLPDMSKAKENFQKIKGKKMWDDLRDIYYNKKMIELTDKRTGKKSFQLLNEAVNEVLESQ